MSSPCCPSEKSQMVHEYVTPISMRFLGQIVFFFLIGVYLLYKVALVSTVQQSKSAICAHLSPLFCISFPFRSPPSTEQSLLGYSFLGVICFMHSSVYMSIPTSQFIPHPGVHTFILCVSLFVLCKHRFIRT